MTENIEKTVEELQAELDARRAEAAHAEPVQLSTRDRSPVKPQDHQPKAELKDSKAEVTHKEKTFKVDFEALDDADLMDRDPDNPWTMALMIKAVIGVDGYEALRDIVRTDDGKAKMSDVSTEFQAVMEAASAKN